MGQSDHAMTAHKRVTHCNSNATYEGGDMEFPFMTIKEYCKVMRINRSTFYRRKESGVIPPEAVISEQGQRPIVNFAAANPEGYAILKELMGK